MLWGKQLWRHVCYVSCEQAACRDPDVRFQRTCLEKKDDRGW